MVDEFYVSLGMMLRQHGAAARRILGAITRRVILICVSFVQGARCVLQAALCCTRTSPVR